LELLEEVWASAAPGLLYTYSFVDDVVGQQYRQEERLGTIVRYATFGVVLIACLGLFGLASLVVARRTKEIGVRKVLGASAENIFGMITLDFVKLVAAAYVLAAPAAYFILSSWLESFAYATALKAGIFMIAGVLAVAISVLAVGYQSMRAALSNPVDSLRYE
jgi:putative ABC transport system permease protein